MTPAPGRKVKPNYEPGMAITYEPVSKRVVVAFRGRIVVLPEAVESEEQAIRAGEDRCRQLGWNPEEWRKPRRTHFRTLS